MDIKQQRQDAAVPRNLYDPISISRALQRTVFCHALVSRRKPRRLHRVRKTTRSRFKPGGKAADSSNTSKTVSAPATTMTLADKHRECEGLVLVRALIPVQELTLIFVVYGRARVSVGVLHDQGQ
jgi:hypothetical protein